MQAVTKLLKENAFVIFVQIVGLAAVVFNLYLASQLYPLADTDRRLEFQIDSVQAQVVTDRELTDTKFDHIKQQLADIKDLIKTNHK